MPPLHYTNRSSLHLRICYHYSATLALTLEPSVAQTSFTKQSGFQLIVSINKLIERRDPGRDRFPFFEEVFEEGINNDIDDTYLGIEFTPLRLTELAERLIEPEAEDFQYWYNDPNWEALSDQYLEDDQPWYYVHGFLGQDCCGSSSKLSQPSDRTITTLAQSFTTAKES